MTRTHSISTNMLALLLAGLGVVAASCTTDTNTEADSTTTTLNGPLDVDASSPDGDVAVQSYEVTGVVRSVTPSGSHLVVEHDAIAGLMDAMTMPFAVSDTVSTVDIDVGDRVRFMLTRTAEGFTIHSISRRP